MKEDLALLLLELEALGFKRISDAIVLLWDTPELDNYFYSLLVDNRGNREGFPLEVFKILIKLSNIHNQTIHWMEPYYEL